MLIKPVCENTKDIKDILVMSENKELSNLMETNKAKKQEIVMDNPYIAAINNAVNRVNDVTQKKIHITKEILYHEIIMDKILLPEDRERLKAEDEDFHNKLCEVKERYVVASLLLDAAQGLEEKMKVLKAYTKDMPLNTLK